MIATYKTYSPTNQCFDCYFYRYDSFHDESYCSHDPLADMIGPRALIDSCGSCEFFTEENQNDSN